MSRKCSVTGKKGLRGNNVSHSNRKTKRTQEVNLQWKRIWVEELGRWFRVRVAASTLRTIAKKGAASVLHKAGLINLSNKKHNAKSKTK